MMKLLFQYPKKKDVVTLEIDPQTSIEQARDELISKHGFPKGDYKFIFKGKILSNPAPFSKLEENTRLIVYVKTEEAKPPQPPQAPAQQPPVEPIQPSQPRQRQQSEQEVLNVVSPILRSSITNMLMEKIYSEEDNFYNHPKEVSEISQIIDESIYGLMVEFIHRHFEITLNFTDASPDKIMSIIGNNVLYISRICTDFSATLMELSHSQRAIFERIKSLNNDPKVVLDTLIACDFDEARTTDCLRQMDKQ